jgi:hypothetical protein
VRRLDFSFRNLPYLEFGVCAAIIHAALCLFWPALFATPVRRYSVPEDVTLKTKQFGEFPVMALTLL